MNFSLHSAILAVSNCFHKVQMNTYGSVAGRLTEICHCIGSMVWYVFEAIRLCVVSKICWMIEHLVSVLSSTADDKFPNFEAG